MTVATLAQLEEGVRRAYTAGNMEYARVLGAELVRARQDPVNQIPDMPIQQPPAPEPGFTDRVIGAGETALTLATGATGGTVGAIGGTLKGLAEQILAGKFGTPEAARAVEDAAMQGAEALTYKPRSETGQEMAAAAGEALSGLVPMAGLSGEAAVLANTSRAAAAPAALATRAKVGAAAQRVKQAIPGMPGAGPKGPTAGTQASGGAAAVDMATVRQERASELPVPIQLTEGQKTREFQAQRFERETAKDPELGGPIRERMQQQNAKLVQNLDSFIDATGAEAADLTSIGIATDSAMRARAARDKVRIRSLYKEAEKAGEMESPVQLDTLATFLTENAPEAEVANVLKAARAKALQLGILVETPDGGLMAAPAPLKRVELFRRSINNATNAEPTNINFAGQLKRLIDEQTDGLGGNLYKQARAARARYAADYENIGLVRSILGMKRGSTDRAIAMEDILRRSILEPSTSVDTVRQVRRLLQTEGENGRQAWRELQGGVIRHIRDEATKNVARDEAGNPIVSAAALDRVITQLDKTGKLDFVFGKRGAEQIRVLNDVAKDVLVAPPGSVNTSNTASVILGAMDMSISGIAGMPAPILSGLKIVSGKVKSAKVRARVRRILGEETHKNKEISKQRGGTILEPRPLPQRPFPHDYPQGTPEVPGSLLERDMEGRRLVAPSIAGRRTSGGNDEAVPAGQGGAIASGLRTPVRDVPAKELSRDALGEYDWRTAGGSPGEIRLFDQLPDVTRQRVLSHEVSHLIDDVAGKIPVDGIKKELLVVYNETNNALRDRGGKSATGHTPEMSRYKRPAEADRELVAEGIRAYMADPNYFKTVAPKAAARIRKYVNEHPELMRVIQFNALAAFGVGLGLAGAGGEQQRND